MIDWSEFSNGHLVSEDLVVATMGAFPGGVDPDTIKKIREAIRKELERQVERGRLVILHKEDLR